MARIGFSGGRGITRPISPPLELTELVDAVCSETEALAIAQAAQDYPMKIKPDVVRWSRPGWAIYKDFDETVTADRIYYIPVFVTETTTYIRIGIYVRTLGAGNADLRIFEWDNGLPGALILSAGTVDTGTTGEKEITIAEELTRGYYFLAVRFTGTPECVGVDPAAPYDMPVEAAGTSVLSLDLSLAVMYVDAVYADPAPAPTAITTVKYAFPALREN